MSIPHQPFGNKVEHLYVHIPFCHRICPYCSFVKHTPGNTDIGAFVRSLLSELKHYSRKFEIKPKTIYFGGGTPSMLSPTHLDALFSGLSECIDHSNVAEITFEANPATFTASKARQFAELGISRVSLGIQSWDAEVLKVLGREHTPMQAEESYFLLREAGIPEINIDQMFAIPGQTLEAWSASLQQTLDLRPDHLSCYNLTYEEDTDFFEKLKAGAFHQDPEADAPFFELADQKCSVAGYEHYETSNFALSGKQSEHNSAYWLGRDYLGIGPGAVSTVAGQRWQNVADTPKYMHLIETRGAAPTDIEVIDESAWRLERLALMMRTSRGIQSEWLESVTRAEELVDQGYLEPTEKGYKATGNGTLLVDSLIEHLLL